MRIVFNLKTDKLGDNKKARPKPRPRHGSIPRHAPRPHPSYHNGTAGMSARSVAYRSAVVITAMIRNRDAWLIAAMNVSIHPVASVENGIWGPNLFLRMYRNICVVNASCSFGHISSGSALLAMSHLMIGGRCRDAV